MPATASWPAAASRPMSSPPRSPASWPALSGLLPGACRPPQADRSKRVNLPQGGASEQADTLLLGKAGGAAAVRRTLASTICRASGPTQVPRPRQLHDASTVMRFRPAHQRMINRRHDGRVSCPAQYSPHTSMRPSPTSSTSCARPTTRHSRRRLTTNSESRHTPIRVS